MQVKKLFISFLILTLTATVSNANKTKIKYTEYTIQSGDTLSVIAKKHHTTANKVRKENKLGKSELIKVGQQLKIPTDTYFPENTKSDSPKQKKNKASNSSPKAKKIEKGTVEYTISAGDTIFSIAKQHHTTTKEVREKNGMEYNTIIRIGQKIIVPTNTYFPSKTKKSKNQKIAKKGVVDYIIELGDTVFTIAKKHHTTTKEIREMNGMEYGAIIKVGQKLKVPVNTYFPDQVKAEEIAIAKKRKKEGIYEIVSGDTLFSIARKNHVTIKAIMDINNLKYDSIIKIGQLLKIHKNSSYATKTTNKSNKKIAKSKTKKRKKKFVVKKHKIKKGDTLSRIAKDNGTTVKKLRRLNKLSKNAKLKIGQMLALGRVAITIKKEKQQKTYKVKKGDTLSRIAKINNTTVKRLRSINHLKKKSKLRVGIVLAINKKPTKKIIKTTKTKVASKTKHKNRRTSDAMAVINGRGKSSNRSTRNSSRVIRTAKKYLGTRYVWGAVGPNKFDCSGFTQYVLRKSKGIRLPRVSRQQAYYGKYVSRKNLRPADLIFFDTSHRRRGYVNHVGIYIGSNKFIHASSARHRVAITSLNRPFYRARFKWGRRVY